MIKFGPSGNSKSFYDMGLTTTLQTPKYLHDMGLEAFEYSFGRGNFFSMETGEAFGAEFAKYNIEVSVHAPYFINLANTEQDKIEKSIGYVLSSLKRVKAMGGKRCIFHVGSVGKRLREESFAETLKNTGFLLAAVYDAGYGDMILCPETMGKINQIGTVDEILQICKTDKIFIPAFDFGHINSREKGLLKTKDDYKIIIDKIFAALGEERAKNIHIHFSKIQYGAGGEIRHLTMDDTIYGPEFEPLAEVLYQYKMTPVVLSESDGTQAEDALKMKNIYYGIAGAE
jgi:deoxyribonuclease-4